MESLIEILKSAWEWMREYNADIIGTIFVVIFAVGLFPNFKSKKKPKDIERATKATLPKHYAKTYKSSSSTVIVSTPTGDNKFYDIYSEYAKDNPDIFEEILKPWEPIDFDPPDEKKEDKPLKRKLDL